MMYSKIVADAEVEDTLKQVEADPDGAVVIDWGLPFVLTAVLGEVPSGKDGGQGRDLLVVAAVEFFLENMEALLSDDAFSLVGAHYTTGKEEG